VSFLEWTFLLGAVAVVGPVVAHMLAKPRFRRVPFTMLQFLLAGRQESHSRRKLRDLLVLLLRCTIIALLAVLFARPVLHVKAKPPKHRPIHYLALDDSASMAYQDGGTTLLERMIGTAADYIRRAPDDTVFNICGLASGRSVDGLTRNQALVEVKRLTSVPRSARLTEFLSTLKQTGRTAAPGDAISAVVLSDFTPGILNLWERVHEPACLQEFKHEIIAPKGPVNNAAIVEARAVAVTDKKLNIDVVIANYGDSQQRDLTLKSRDLKPVSMKVDLAPHERRVVRVQVDAGLTLHRPDRVCLPVELSLAPADNLIEDDHYRLAVYIPSHGSVNVLVVHRGAESFLFETAIQTLAKQAPTDGLILRKVQEGRLKVEDLAWAGVVVFSSLPAGLSCPPRALKDRLGAGGRLVFFLTQAGSRQTTEYLLREGVLPAVPEKWVPEMTHPEPQPLGGRYAVDDQVLKSLLNYRCDKIALKGYWQCRATADAECLWRLANGAGFIYRTSLNSGSSLLVDTSMDDSLGLLAKSSAWVAFCRLVLGEDEQVRQFCFCPEDRPILNLPDSARTARPTALAVENCDGSRTQAASEGTRVLLPRPAGLGWMRTLGEPTLYAAVNLPPGETDMGTPTEETVADAMRRAFVTSPTAGPAPALASMKDRNRPAWKAFAWAALLLLLIEPAITNRLKR
jgi:hypothetical protein